MNRLAFSFLFKNLRTKIMAGITADFKIQRRVNFAIDFSFLSLTLGHSVRDLVTPEIWGVYGC